MATRKISSTRKKKIKSLLAMMNKQNQRFIPVATPLVEMMDMVITDEELDYLIPMGTDSYDYDKAFKVSRMPENQFQSFFDKMQRKGLVHVESDTNGKEKYPGRPPKIPHKWPLVITPPVSSLTRDEEGKKHGYSSTYPPRRAKI